MIVTWEAQNARIIRNNRTRYFWLRKSICGPLQTEGSTINTTLTYRLIVENNLVMFSGQFHVNWETYKLTIVRQQFSECDRLYIYLVLDFGPDQICSTRVPGQQRSSKHVAIILHVLLCIQVCLCNAQITDHLFRYYGIISTNLCYGIHLIHVIPVVLRFGACSTHLDSVLFCCGTSCVMWACWRIIHVLEVDKLFWKYGSPVLAVDVHRNGRACNEGTYAHFTAMLLNPWLPK
jgi:hypothetical protein